MNASPEPAFMPAADDPDQVRREIMAQIDARGWRFFTGVRFSQPPHVARQVKTAFDHSTALENAREYLEQAGYYPQGSPRKKKFRKKQPTPQTLRYTRGATSKWEIFLVPSPKNMRINVTVSGVPVDDFQHTLAQIDYHVELPAGVGVARPSCDFWIAEVLELEQAIVAEQFDRSETRRHAARATAYCLARNYMNCAFTVAVIGMLPLWLLSPRSDRLLSLPGVSLLDLPLSLIGPPILLMILCAHSLLAIRLGR